MVGVSSQEKDHRLLASRDWNVPRLNVRSQGSSPFASTDASGKYQKLLQTYSHRAPLICKVSAVQTRSCVIHRKGMNEDIHIH